MSVSRRLKFTDMGIGYDFNVVQALEVLEQIMLLS